MASDMTEEQKVLARRFQASIAVLDAKHKEHEAACVLQSRAEIAEARAACHSALEALLDARENALYKLYS